MGISTESVIFEVNKMKNKLYVWPEFEPDYAEGLAFAIAPTLEEAKAMIIKECGGEMFAPDNWGDLEIRNLSKCAYCVPGGA